MTQISTKQAWDFLKEMCAADPDYAWSLHCNLAMPIMDVIGVDHQQSNVAAAYLMQHLFDHDITNHEHYQYEKSPAQEYVELRSRDEREEDLA